MQMRFIHCGGKKIFVNLKSLILLKVFSLWLSGCSLDTFQFPSFAEQLPFAGHCPVCKAIGGFCTDLSLRASGPKGPLLLPRQI